MNRVFDVLGMIVVVSGIMVLVRPNSQGPAFVDSLGRFFTGALTVSTGSGVPSGYQVTGFN